MKRKLLKLALKPVTMALSVGNRLSVALVEDAIPTFKSPTKHGDIRFYCPSLLTLFRAKSLLSKEPDTIEWIDSFEKNDILFDIGANVGVYSLYAGKTGIQVYAFEPEAQNYAVLNRNVALNQLQDFVSAFNIALSDSMRADYLFISSTVVGGALNNFGEQVDFNKQQFQAKFKQAVIAHSLDGLIREVKLPLPHHIKIDVDGLERMVINGALETINNTKLKSLLIELNTKLSEDLEIIDIMTANGFKIASKFHAPQYDNSEWKDIYNFIFRR